MSAKNFTYTLEIDAEIKNLVAKTEQVKKSMAGLTANGKMPEMDKQLQAIERSLTKLQEKAATPITSAAAFGNMQKDVAAAKVAIEGLGGSVTKLQTASTGEKLQFIDPNMLKTIQAADSALDTFGVAVSEASKKTADLVTAEKLLAAANRDVEKAQNGVNKSQEKADAAKSRADAAKQEAEAIKKKLEVLQKWQATQKAYDTADASGKKPDKRSAISPDVNYRKDKNAAEGLGIDISTPEKLNAAIQTLTASLTTQESEVSRLNGQYITAEKSLKNHRDKLTDATNASNSAQVAFDKLNAEFEQNKAKNSQAAFDTLRASLEKLGIKLSDIPTQYTEQNLEALRAKCEQFKNQGVQGVDASLSTLEQSLRETGEAADTTGNKISESAQDFKKLDEQVGQTQAFANRIKQFVGLQGAAMLARRALRNAFQSIKELDAAMAEMAVVTDTDISGYWDQLPEYTARANEMGLAIKDVYKADTLFYQQGLKKEQVMALSTETMKMARIAGLETAEATDRMTAALRGFNMELNETNAQRVADVYSQLAAITASDVDEISSAMTKTASIAASAGMEFETTAAFLSQIIETTRESAETAGTALKTVIARFQELKKDPSEIGEVDGEIVDANKIETALRSVGVALRDSSGQFRELDDVFMELSAKWDGLDTNTQRYIATIAAGSRQQSRFIAMMSDYSRTSELVTAANTSAGASNEQFEKTMEGIEAKLNQLSNAWKTFTMGIMDSDLLKAGVDLLTQILTTINNITDAFGQFSGAAKIAVIITALYLGDKALKVFLGSFAKSKSVFTAFRTVGTTAVSSVSNGFTRLNKNLTQASLNSAKLNKIMTRGFSKSQTAAIQTYNMHLSREQKLNQARITTKSKMLALERQGKKETAEYIALQTHYNNTTAIADTQTRKRVLSEAALFAAMELTEAQQKEAIALTGMGISADVAASLASAGYTAAQIHEMAVTKGVTDAQMAEMLVKDANTKKTGLAAVASFILASAQTLQQQGLRALIKSWWSQLAAKISDIAATWGQVGANVALQASMWPVLVVGLLLIAAIAGLVLIVMAFIALIKYFQSLTPEAKLEAASEAADKASEAADKAAEAYNNLSESFASLGDKYKGLEEMTKGTREWRDAVREINKEVMDLTEQYPELANLVTNEDGVLSIDLEGEEAQAILDKYEQNATVADSAAIGAKMAENKAQSAVDRNNLTEAATVENEGARLGINIGASVAGVLMPGLMAYSAATIAANEAIYAAQSEQTDALAQAMAQGLIVEGSDGWQITEGSEEALAELGLAGDKAVELANGLGEGAKELQAYGQSLNEARAQEEAMQQALAANALSMVDSTKFSEEQQKQMSNMANSDYMENMMEETEKQLNQQLSNMSKEEQKSFYTAEAQKIYGDSATADDKGNITYIDDSGEEQTVSAEAFKQQLIASKATEQFSKALESVPARINKVATALDKFDKGLGAAYKSLLADPSKTTKGQAGQLTANAFKEDGSISDEMYNTLYNSFYSMSKEEKDMYGGDLNKYIEEVTGPLADINKLFAESEEKIRSYSSTITEVNGSFTTDALKGYEKVLGQLSSSLGKDKEALADINNSINALATEMSEEDFNTFMSQFNALDFTDLNSLEGFEETLKNMGLANITTSASFDSLIDQCIEASGAIRKVDFSAFIASFREMQGMIGKINAGEQGRTGFSQEDYDKLVKQNPDLAKSFVLENDGTYTYLGDSMTDLTVAINELTEVERQNQKSILVDKINAAGMIESLGGASFAGTDQAMDIKNSQDWSADEMREYISTVVGSANLNNIDLANLGIAGLSSNTTDADIETMSDDDVKAIVQGLSGIYGEKSTNESNYDKLDTEAAYSSARNYSMEHNIGSVNSLQSQAGMEGVDNDALLNNLQVRMSAIMSQAIEEGASEASLSEYRALMDTVAGLDPTDENFAETLANLDFATPTQGLMDSIALLEEAEETTESWVSQYGYLDQLNREISRETLKRNRLESEYDRLLKSEGVTQEQLLQNVTKRLGALNKELNLNIQKGAEAEEALSRMTDESGENADFAQFVNYDATTGSIQIDYEAAQTEFGDSTELGEKFDEYVGALYELQDTADESRENIEDINSEVEEIKRTGADEYNDLAHQISDALNANFQKQIDALSEVNDSISELNDSIVSSIQEAVDQQRQDRENEKAEQNITDKEARLAYLKMDTSGANALEIASLEKEIADSKESYGDSLIDQSLQSLEDANAKAAEQRQQQIDLAQKQLEAYVSSGQAIADAEKLVQAATVEGAASLNAGLTALGLSMSTDYTALGTSITGMGTNFITQSMIESATLATSLGETGAIATSLGSTGAIATSLGESGILATSLGTTGVLASLIGSDGATGLSGDLSNLLSTTADLHNMTEDEKATWQDNIDTAVNGAAVFLGIQNALGGEDGKAKGSVQDTLETEFEQLDLKLDNIMGAEGTTMSGIRDNIINDILGGAEGKDLTDIESSLSGLLTDTEEQSLLEGIATAAGSPTPDYAGVYQALKDKNNSESPLFQDYSSDIGSIEDKIAKEAEAKVQKEKDQQTFDQIRTWNDLIQDDVEISEKDFNALKAAGKIADTQTYQSYKTARQAHQDKLGTQKLEERQSFISDFSTSVGQKFNAAMGKDEERDEESFVMDLGSATSGYAFFDGWQYWDDNVTFSYDGYTASGLIVAQPGEKDAGHMTSGTVVDKVKEAYGEIIKGHVYYYKDQVYFAVANGKLGYFYDTKGENAKKNTSIGKAMKQKLLKYETGGLANFTGPAWLDGTKSHPELVLNARDTENFIQLKDILAHVMNSANISDSSVSNGDNYYEIEINVESLENDYDVEQLANKIRSMIYQDATYRNVNVLSQKA